MKSSGTCLIAFSRTDTNRLTLDLFDNYLVSGRKCAAYRKKCNATKRRKYWDIVNASISVFKLQRLTLWRSYANYDTGSHLPFLERSLKIVTHACAMFTN